MSSVAVSKVWPRIIGSAANPKPHAASACAPRPPPNSRVSSATTTTAVIVARVAGIRTAQVASANTARMPAATSGVSGGWST